MSTGAAVEPVPQRSSSAAVLLASPLYRGATVAIFLSSIGFSAAAPQISLFLVNDLHASLSTAGLYYLTNVTAPFAGYVVGARSDLTGKRFGLFRLCAVAGFVGWVGIALSTRTWMPFVISAVVLAFSGAAASQLFAAVHDDLQSSRSEVADGVISLVRMAMTAGWIIGPTLGALLAAAVNPRALLAATGVLFLVQVLPRGLRPTVVAAGEPGRVSHHADRRTAARGRQVPAIRVMLPLLAFTGLYALVYAGEPVKYGYLPIYMHDDLRLPAAVSGAVIGIQPLIELVLMPVAFVVARRVGMMRLMILGAAFDVGANLCFAFTGTTVGMFTGQALMGGVWGVFAGLGVIVAQRLLPQAVATASALFLSSTAIASAVGGLTGAIGVTVLGLPRVFLLSAVYGLFATAGIAVMSRSPRAVH